MLEYLSASFAYSVVKDAWSWLRRRGRGRKLTHEEILALRGKWKKEIEEKLPPSRRDERARDVIVHDVKRLDQYPGGLEGTGLSPWFKAGLMGTYYRGVLLGLQWHGLTQGDDGKWHRTNFAGGEEPDITAVLMGKVRYENIEAIDWDGDQFYNNAHVYLHFAEPSRQPYEELVFCEQRELNQDHFYYSEVARFEDVDGFQPTSWWKRMSRKGMRGGRSSS